MLELIGFVFEILVLHPIVSFLECLFGLMKELPPVPYVRQLRWLAICFLALCLAAFVACIVLAKFSFYAALGSFILSLVSISCAGWIGGKLIKLEVPAESQDSK